MESNYRKKFIEEFNQCYFSIYTSQNLCTLSSFKFTHYKFYQELMETILKWGKETGINLKPILKDIKLSLHQDYKFEKRMTQFFKQGMFQIGSIVMLSWGYYLGLIYTIEKQLTAFEVVMILFWQLIGITLYWYLLMIYKNNFMGRYYQVLDKLYQFSSLYSAGIPLSRLVSETQMFKILAEERDHEMVALKLKIENLVNEVRHKGVSISVELREAIEEVWFLLELRYEKFVELMQVLKMTILLLFFVSTYFLLVYKMLAKNLMEF
ncbi:MAG: hypothetical protein U0T83_02500 [Bacteriovoracaceae bacterium]